MTPVSLYITAPNREEAISLSRELLEARLIACANIVENATSLYWWQGEIEHVSETLIIAKSLSQHVDGITAIVQKQYTYDCPCVVATPITGGNPDYLLWMQQQLAPAEGGSQG